jgi:hypothetical protein
MTAERRRRRRLKLGWRIRLARSSAGVAVTAETDNLNSGGFYCTSEEPFSPGESLECDLFIPANPGALDGPNVVLHRQVKVLRLEIKGLEPGFGIACQFE